MDTTTEFFLPSTAILIVDDMESARAFSRAQLTALGFTQIFEAENGEVALKLIETQNNTGKPIELILSDWSMPVMSGLDFLMKVRAIPEFKKLPFVMITALGDTASVLGAIQAGVTDYLVKPFDGDLLKKKLEHVWKVYQKGASRG